jgi:hypothetical protein
MLTHNLRILNARIGFLLLSFGSFRSFFFLTTLAATLAGAAAAGVCFFGAF